MNEVQLSNATAHKQIIHLIVEFLRANNYNRTVQQIQIETSSNQQEMLQEMQEPSLSHLNQQNQSTSKAILQPQEGKEEQQKEEVKGQSSQKERDYQKEKILSCLSQGASFQELLAKCQSCIGQEDEKKQQEKPQVPDLLRIMNCSWKNLTKYRLPIHKTMRVECSKKIVFLKMCPIDCFCCVIDEGNNVKILDAENRSIVAQLHSKDKDIRLTSVEWIDWEFVMIGDSSGTLKVYNAMNLNKEMEYEKLHDSSILALTEFKGYKYSCSYDKVLKRTKKNSNKAFLCSGYCKLMKAKNLENYLIGVDMDQKNIYVFDEITEKQTLLFSVEKGRKRIGAIEIRPNGNLLVGLEKGHPQVHEVEVHSGQTHQQLKISKFKSMKVSMAQFFNGSILAVSSSNSQCIQYFSTKNWNMIYEYQSEEEKQKNRRYCQIGNAMKQRLIYGNGKWVEMMDIEKQELVEKKAQKEKNEQRQLLFGNSFRNSPAFLSLLQNFQLNYGNMF